MIDLVKEKRSRYSTIKYEVTENMKTREIDLVRRSSKIVTEKVSQVYL